MSDTDGMPSGRINPATLDVAEKPRGNRRVRNRREPAAELRDQEMAARKRALARPYPPGIMLELAGDGQERWTAPHSDQDLWFLQLADAFATRSQAVISTFLTQLEALCGKSHWDEEAEQWRLDENQFSGALALVSSLKPRNEMEAALAAQMVAIHLLTMKTTAFAIQHEYDTRTAATAGKLARTFALQMQSFDALRRKNRTARQLITVRKDLHQHVHYHRGGQQSEGQPHAPAATIVDECPPLPRSQQRGKPLPLPCNEREGPLSNARGSKRLRCTEG